MRIGVLPALERASRARLFDAVEAAMPVRFVGGGHGVDAVVAFGRRAVDGAVPTLTAIGEEAPAAPPPPLGTPHAPAGPALELGIEAPLDRPLRGRRIRDATITGSAPLATAAGATVLARRGRDPLWVSRAGGTQQVVAVAPAELDELESLRDRLRDGRFLGLAALVQFLRVVCAPLGWHPPPLRACFLFDDPNLHWASYGHLHYRDLVREGDRHGYHVAFATVPLDAWFAHRGTARLFRERADRLSLVIHGNDHTRAELAQPFDDAQRIALLSQALRRSQALAQRSGVHVEPVMVAPHGLCSQAMARELVPQGFEALCISRPYPWLARPPAPWLARPADSSPLTGFEPASMIENGLPVLLRRAFSDHPEDLALRAFLGQPLILYGHHADMKGGIERLGELADLVNGLGAVHWTSIGEIAASNVAVRRSAGTLHVRMYARRARVDVPPGVEQIEVDAPGVELGEESIAIVRPAAGGTAEIRLARRDAAAPAPTSVRVPARWAMTRRLLSESRDRLMPIYSTLRQS